MIRLILAPNPTKGIHKKNSSNQEIKNQAKKPLKIMKIKSIAAQDRR
jgi:hypothetical protein